MLLFSIQRQYNHDAYVIMSMYRLFLDCLQRNAKISRSESNAWELRDIQEEKKPTEYFSIRNISLTVSFETAHNSMLLHSLATVSRRQKTVLLNIDSTKCKVKHQKKEKKRIRCLSIHQQVANVRLNLSANPFSISDLTQ